MKLRGRTATAVAAVVIGALALVVSMVIPSLASPDNGGPQARTYTDSTADYGVCRGIDPRCYHDWGQAWYPGQEKKVLIWSRTAGPRHAHLGTPLGPGLNPPLDASNVAQAGLKKWLEAKGVHVDYTEDLAAFKPDNYQAVINLSGNRETFDNTAQTALMQFVRRGGGFVGIHNAFGAEYEWPYYEGLLGGANFYDHQSNRLGTITTLDKKDVSTKQLPKKWQFTDEYYTLVPSPSYVRPLLKVDAATSRRTSGKGHPGMGNNALVSWCQYYDGGRAWLTTLGHDSKDWDDIDGNSPGDVQFRHHVVNGVLSAMGVKPFCK